jgi:hypothetical protein
LFATIVFLASVDLKFAAAVVTGAAGSSLARTLAEREQRKRDTAEAIDLFKSYFGLHQYFCDLGKTYPYGGFHRDHAAAFKGIIGDPQRGRFDQRVREYDYATE